MTRQASPVQVGLDRTVETNLIRVAFLAGVTFLAFSILHMTPLGSGLPSKILGDLVSGIGLLALVAVLKRRREPLRHPNGVLAGVFVWILAGDAFLSYTEPTTASLNIGLFVTMVAAALLLSLPALLVTLAASSAEGIFVASVVPGGHLPTQIALGTAAAIFALLLHANRVVTHRQLEGLLHKEQERRIVLENAVDRATSSEERFHRLADAAFEGLAIHDHGTLLECNAACERMFGYDPGTLAGRSAFDIIHESCHPLIQARIATPIDEPYEALGVRRDGTTFPVEIAGKTMPFKGRMHRVVAIRDLSERQRVRDAEREQTVARRIVRRALVSEARPSAELLAERRALGRSIACEAQAPTIESGLQTFRAMGLGELWLVRQEGKRWVFEGNDMLDRTPGARMPSCSLAVGYVEGLLSSLTGEEMRGAELSCESQGHTECRFVALPRPAIGPAATTTVSAAAAAQLAERG